MPTQLKGMLRALHAARAVGRGLPQGAQHQASLLPFLLAQDDFRKVHLAG